MRINKIEELVNSFVKFSSAPASISILDHNTLAIAKSDLYSLSKKIENTDDIINIIYAFCNYFLNLLDIKHNFVPKYFSTTLENFSIIIYLYFSNNFSEEEQSIRLNQANQILNSIVHKIKFSNKIIESMIDLDKKIRFVKNPGFEYYHSMMVFNEKLLNSLYDAVELFHEFCILSGAKFINTEKLALLVSSAMRKRIEYYEYFCKLFDFESIVRDKLDKPKYQEIDYDQMEQTEDNKGKQFFEPSETHDLTPEELLSDL